MGTVKLNAKLREEAGKGPSRRDRSAGMVPAVLYGEEEAARHILLDYKEFYPVIHTAAGGNVIIDLAIEWAHSADCKAIIKEIQYHPVRRDILHVDFQHISMNKEITVLVPVEAVGTPEGVKKGGILEMIHREVEVTCLPANIPDVIELDVSALEVGDSLQVGDLKVTDAEITDDPEATVVTILAPTKVEIPTPAEAEEEEALAEGEAEEGAEGEEAKPEEGSEEKPES
jgi:large subunit ribosomal protein L25